MAKFLLILVIGLGFESAGVILLKKGIDIIDARYAERRATMPVWKNV